jgi:hypothetical protein
MFLFQGRQACLDIEEKMVVLEYQASRAWLVKKVQKDMLVIKVLQVKLVTGDHQDNQVMLLKENLAIEVFKNNFYEN